MGFLVDWDGCNPEDHTWEPQRTYMPLYCSRTSVKRIQENYDQAA